MYVKNFVQAAFYSVAACAAKGCTSFNNSAALVFDMAQSTNFYMVNKGAFEVIFAQQCFSSA
jgi:hypothetical protein